MDERDGIRGLLVLVIILVVVGAELAEKLERHADKGRTEYIQKCMQRDNYYVCADRWNARGVK